jgi:site-specific DNA recombinase
MTWASYARVSSDGQTGLDRYGLERQDRANDRYIRSQGYAGDVLQLRDVITGTKEHREEFERLLSAARAGTIRRVCIPEPDRLAREAFSGVDFLFELWAAGLEVHNAMRGLIDRKNGESRRSFLRDLIEADSELEKIKRRMYGGRLEKVRSGKPERPLRVYGWNNGVIDEQQRESLKRICQMVVTTGIRQTAFDLNKAEVPTPSGRGKWQHNSVRSIVTNPIIIGQYAFGRKAERLRLEVEPLIDRDLWDAVQNALRARGRGQGRRGSRLETFQLTGRIKCAHCGAAMCGHQTQKYSYYLCSSKFARASKVCDHRKHYSVNQIHDAVLESLQSALDHAEDFEHAATRIAPPKDLTREILQLETRIKRARDAYLSGIDSLDDYTQTRSSLEAQINHLREEATIEPPPRNKEKIREVLIESLAQPNDLAKIAQALSLTVRIARAGEISLEIGL